MMLVRVILPLSMRTVQEAYSKALAVIVVVARVPLAMCVVETMLINSV